MAYLPRITYPPLKRRSQPTAWAADWRRRWFLHVGAVDAHGLTGELVAYYSAAHDPATRLRLQAELEARPRGSDQVLAVCHALAAKLDRAIMAHNKGCKV